MRFFLRLSFVVLLVLSPEICLAQKTGAPPWEAARDAIEKWYKKELPGSKIEEIVPAKHAEIRDFGLVVRYYARLRVQRADGLRDWDEVHVNFIRVAGAWEVSPVYITGLDPISDVEPPTAAQALLLFRAAWKKDLCEGYVINEVKAGGEPDFQRESVSGDRTKARRWYVYDLEVRATGTGDFKLSEAGAPYMLEIRNRLVWNPADRSWSVDPTHVKCSGFDKAKEAGGSGESAELEPPALAEAQRLFRDVWKKDKCDGYEITQVDLAGKPRYHDSTSGDRWFVYDLEIRATGTGDFKLSEEGASYTLPGKGWLLWNAASKAWSVDLRYAKCSGFVKGQ